MLSLAPPYDQVCTRIYGDESRLALSLGENSSTSPPAAVLLDFLESRSPGAAERAAEMARFFVREWDGAVKKLPGCAALTAKMKREVFRNCEEVRRCEIPGPPGW